MKTSNKILLGAFLTSLLIIISVHVALYAKYKKGEFTLVSDDMWPTNMVTYSLHNVKYISVDNIENLTIQASDSSNLKYDKPGDGDGNILSVTKKNDTLFLSGKGDRNSPGRWYRTTHLSLADLLPVMISNSNVHLQNAKNNKLISIDLRLDKSSMDVNNRQNVITNFSSFKIEAINKSRINLFNVTTHVLDVKLKDSFLEESNLQADSISITTDLASKIQLSGTNFLKAKIVNN